MSDNDFVSLLVEVPRALRVRVRVLVAQRETTIGRFVVAALEAAVAASEAERDAR